MTIQLSNRVQSIKPSPTLAVTARAAAMKAAGKDIVGLGAGEPDFDTPQHIKDAAIAAINSGFTKYTAVEGTASLRQAIIKKFQRDNGLTYSLGQVLVSCGGKQSFYNLAQALLNPGDEVIIPAPYWVSYPDMVLLADAVPIIVSADQSQQFKITAEQLQRAITAKTRLFVINSPSNPTGMAYTNDELRSLAAVLLAAPHVVIATDDMYEHIVWNGEITNILRVCPDLYDRTVLLNGVSKAYSMTGWRIGYAAGPENLMRAMGNIQSQSTSNPTSISQVAAECALNGDQTCVRTMTDAFKDRHDWFVEQLNTLPGVSCLRTDGTFYVFPQFTGVMQRMGMKTDTELAEMLIESAGVALVPGSAFGCPGHLRASIATGMDNLRQAIERLARVLT